MEYIDRSDELSHYGIMGMKWGVRKDKDSQGSKKPSYRSTSLRSALSRRSNEKVDASFRNWNKNAKKKADAVELGKARNEKKIASELNSKDKGLRKEARAANREYKRALRGNTTYRKGQIRGEVGKDLSRKYMTEAKRAYKSGDSKTYEKFMNKHDVERASARRAPEVGAKRSARKAALKRAATMTVKTAAATAAVSAGVYALNRYGYNINADQVARAKAGADYLKRIGSYLYF